MVVLKIRQLLFCAKDVTAQEAVYIRLTAGHMYSEMFQADAGVGTVEHTHFKHKYHVGDLTQKFHP
jgi:hypothetical protein